MEKKIKIQAGEYKTSSPTKSVKLFHNSPNSVYADIIQYHYYERTKETFRNIWYSVGNGHSYSSDKTALEAADRELRKDGYHITDERFKRIVVKEKKSKKATHDKTKSCKK